MRELDTYPELDLQVLGIADEAGLESFPASDAPAHTATTGLGPPTSSVFHDKGLPDVVHEHPISDPEARTRES